MTNKNSNNTLKIVIGILIFLLLGAVFFGVTNYSKLKDNTAAFETEKAIKVEELKSLQTQYDNLIAEDAENKEEIAASRERISRLIDSVSNLEADVEVIDKLRKSQAYYKNQLKKLTAENEALKEENLLLNVQKDSLNTELENAVVVYDSLSQSNVQLQQVVAKAQELRITNVAPSAVRIKGSNKVVKTTKAKKVTGIEVCYDVAPNAVAKQGDKELYIQVVSPSKKIIGGQYYFNEGERKLNFSKVSKFRYNNKAMNICDFVEPLPNEAFESGTYSVNVFSGIDLIHSSTITLK